MASRPTATPPATDFGIFLRTRPAHATSWTPWKPLLGDNDADGIVAATDYDGGLNIVTPVGVSAGTAGLAHKRRLPDGTWTDWTMLGNPPGGLNEYIAPVLVTGADSPLGVELFAVAVDSTIWHNAQTAAGDWSDWASLGNTGNPSPASPSPKTEAAPKTAAAPSTSASPTRTTP